MLLFYIRHGDPIYAPNQLTPLGHRQAEAVARRLARYGIDRIYASESNRAMQTAVPTAEITKQQIIPQQFCMEELAWADFAPEDENGDKRWVFENKLTRPAMTSPEAYRLAEKWYEHPDLAPYNFGPAQQRVHREVDEFLLSLGYEHDRQTRTYRAVGARVSAAGGKADGSLLLTSPAEPLPERVALFAHHGFGLLFLSSVLDIPYPEIALHFNISHTGMTVIDFNEQDGIVIPQALTVANDSHIYADGLPTKYNNTTYF